MAVNVGDIVTAAQYINLQSAVADVLGTGSGNSGYGQTLASSSVSQSDIITAEHMENLRTDIVKASYHQVNAAPTLGVVNAGNLILAGDPSDAVDRAFNDYDEAINGITGIVAYQFLADAAQMAEVTGSTTNRTTTWNTTVSHTITLTFTSVDQRRYFFNSGGEVRFEAELTNLPASSDASYSKCVNWRDMLAAMKKISFNYEETYQADPTASGTGSVIGNYELTASDQQIFTKAGSGVYAANDYVILARYNSSNAAQIIFTIQFKDDAAGNPNNDEVVKGTLTSRMFLYHAVGDYVAVDNPSVSASAL